MVESSKYEVPVRILRVNTRKILSDSLNAKKLLKTKDDLCRDWRGLAHLCSVTITNQSNPPADPTDYVLMKWQEQERATIGQFIEFLGRLDRYDVIDDTTEVISRDVERYLHLKDSVSIRAVQEEAASEQDEQILTVDDVCRIERGLGPQMYDAFVLYADEEWDGAKVIVNQLEMENFKICLKDRDVVAGLSFEHKAVMTLIEERCYRLIVMLSPKFVESPMNKFFHLFAQACQIEKKMRKVIPCIYKKFSSPADMPSEFKYYKSLNYEDLYRWRDNFWLQLRKSIILPHHATRINQIEPNSVRIQELPSSVSNEIHSSLPSSSCSEVGSSDRIQIVGPQQQTSTEKTVKSDSSDSLIIPQHSNRSLKNNSEKAVLNDGRTHLLSELRSAFKMVTKIIVPGRSKESRKKARTKCSAMA